MADGDDARSPESPPHPPAGRSAPAEPSTPSRQAPRGATILRFPSLGVAAPDDAPAPAADVRLRDVIGEVLREERLDQQRTLADVAREAAVSLPYLSEVERGRKEVSSDVLRSIGDALDLPLADILERSARRLRTTMRSGSGVMLLAA